MSARPLPPPAFVLICIATGILWLAVTIALVAIWLQPMMWGEIVPRGVDGTGAAPAILLQQGVVALGLLAVLGFGTAVLTTQLQGALERAATLAIWLVHSLIALAVLNLLANIALPVALGGSVLTVFPILLGSLPMTLTQIALLLCAAAYFRGRPDDVFE